MTENIASIGPGIARHWPGKLDGRTRKARVIREIMRRLTAHVGGHPSATQEILIARAANLEWELRRLDERVASDGLSEHASRVYLAMHNHLRLALRELGLKGAAAKPPTIEEALAAGKSAAA